MQSRIIRQCVIVAAAAIAGVAAGRDGTVHAGTATNQRAVNIGSTTATIVWDSAVSESGSVNFGTTCGASDSGLTSAGGPDVGNGLVHVVTLSGLSPSTTYYYDVVSGGQTSDNGGACFQVKTAPTSLPPPPIIAVGHVFTGSPCTTPVTSGIVTVTDQRTGASSASNEASINDASSGSPGTYSGVLSPAPTADSSGWFSAASGDTISVTADNGTVRVAASATWNGSDNPITMPDICLTPPSACASATTVTLQAGAGWNMVGGCPLTLWSDAQANWSFNAATPAWFTPTGSEPAGTGAWEYVSTAGPRSVNVVACPSAVTVPVTAHRWNLVGNPCNRSVSLPSTSRAYWWDPVASHYVLVTSITPGAAAWVKPDTSSLALS